MDKKSLKSFQIGGICLQFAIAVFAATSLFVVMNSSQLFEKIHDSLSPNHDSDKLDRILLATVFGAAVMMIFCFRRWMELRRTYKILAKSEEQLRFQGILLDEIGDSITATDLEGKITYVNEAECRFMKKNKDELIGKSVEVYGEDASAGATQQQIIKATLKTGRWTGEIVNAAADGSKIIVDCHTWLMKDDRGRLTGLCGTARDITDKKLHELELLKHKQYLEALDKASKILLLSISEIQYEDFLAVMGKASGADRVALFLKKTRSDSEIVIYKSAQWLKNQTITPINFEEVNDLFLANIWPRWQKNLSQGLAISSLYADFPAEEQPLWEALDVKAILVLPIIIDNELEGFISFDNCTESRLWTKLETDFLHTAANDLAIAIKRLDYKKELKEQRDFAQRLVETAQTIVLVIDTNANIVTFNPYFEKLSGYKLEDVKGKNWFDTFLPPEYREKTHKLFETIIKKIPTKGNINPILTKSGQLRYIEWFNKELEDTDGKIIAILATGQDITERLKAEELLRESEEKFRIIFDNSNDGILLADIKNKKFFMGNKTICDMLGYSIEEIKKIGVQDIHPKEDLPFIEEQFSKLARQEIILAEDIPMQRKDGSTFFADINANSTIISGKTYLVGSFRDVTERKIMQEKLQQESIMRKTLLDNLPCVALVIKKGTREIVASNEAARKIGAIPGEKCYEICGNLNAPCPFCLAPDTWSTNEPQRLEVEHQGKHYEGIWIPLTEDLYVHYIFDITERKKAKETLAAQRMFSSVILENMDTGVVACNEKGELVLFNRVARDWHGLDPLNIPQKEWADHYNLYQEDGITLMDANAIPLVRAFHGEKVHNIGMVIAAKGQPKRNILTHAGPIKGEGGRILGAITVMHDITDYKRAEEELRNAHFKLEQRVEERTAELRVKNTLLLNAIEEKNRIQKVLQETEKLAAAGKLAAQIAHEINNPLAGIKNSFLLVKDAIPAEHRYFEYVGRIEKEIDRVSQIVRHMFDLYRPGTSPVGKFRLYETINDIIELLKIARQEKNIYIKIDCDPNIVITLSEALLRQVIYNIVQNAIQACGEKATIKIFASIQNDNLKLSVSDQGQGIDDEIKDKIFMPFFTTGSGGPKSGLGLGLSITKDIITAMDGTIDFVSEKGKGTTFNILIPVSNEKI